MRASVRAVPEDKSTPEEGAEAASAPTDLESAMQEAVESMERREGGGAAAKDDKPSAQDAITEALIKAKNELEEAHEQTKKEVDRLRERWMRAAADLENYKKRAAREREETAKFANERLLKDFLPIIDDMELAVAATKQVEDKEKAADQLMSGVELVLKKFVGQLEKHQVSTFEAVGEPFDPALHEAVQQEHTELDAGKVTRQLQRGFKLNERLLRPAMVVVSLGPEKGGDAD